MPQRASAPQCLLYFSDRYGAKGVTPGLEMKVKTP
jgi:hypothetical protein